MKIRASYVSNSSSSSYLIICKSFEEFDKFKVFKGYDTFMKDLQKSRERSALDWIAAEIRALFYCRFRAACAPATMTSSNIYDTYIARNNTYELTHYAIEYSDQPERCVKTQQAEIALGYIITSTDSNEERKQKCEDFIDSLNYEELAKEVLDSIKNKGYNLRSIRYEDDLELGYYMEHYFMPFLAQNPEAEKQQVFTRSEH